MTDQSAVAGTTLLFIDEIQSSPKAIKMLRVFYEFLPAVHVIAAGSLLEVMVKLYLLYPTTTTEIPILPDLRKSPRLQFLDTGLLNFVAGLQCHFFQQEDLPAFYRGKIAEHIVGQELLAATTDIHKKPVFWVKEKKQSSAEVDYIVQHNELAIPVEVKSGKAGTLRSLHQFMDQSPHPYAVRLYSGKLELMETQTIGGRRYWLLNLPYFLAGRLNDYVGWMVEQPADKRS